MSTEFPGRFMRLFAGPMWSGRPIEDRQKPQKVLDCMCLIMIFYNPSLYGGNHFLNQGAEYCPITPISIF